MTARMNPYFVLNGNAREAIAFYERALEGKVISIDTFGGGPADPNYPLSDEAKNRIMHALLRAGETDLMFSDTFPGQPYQTGNNVNIAIVTDDVDQSKRMFSALAEGGQVIMPIQATFWSPAYGSLVDKFGVTWQITTEGKA